MWGVESIGLLAIAYCAITQRIADIMPYLNMLWSSPLQVKKKNFVEICKDINYELTNNWIYM